MVTEADLERERAMALRRVQRDEISRLKSAYEDGFEKGLEIVRKLGLQKGRKLVLEQGKLIGIIHFCQDFLRIAQSPIEQLNECSMDELRERAKILEDEVLKQWE